MKKFVLASVMALASIGLVSAPSCEHKILTDHHQGSGRVQRLSNGNHTERCEGQSLGSGEFLAVLPPERGQVGRSRSAH